MTRHLDTIACLVLTAVVLSVVIKAIAPFAPVLVPVLIACFGAVVWVIIDTH
jgi:hypothetical protein